MQAIWYICIHIILCTYKEKDIYIYISMCINMHIYVICMYIYIHLYKYIHIDRHTPVRVLCWDSWLFCFRVHYHFPCCLFPILSISWHLALTGCLR